MTFSGHLFMTFFFLPDSILMSGQISTHYMIRYTKLHSFPSPLTTSITACLNGLTCFNCKSQAFFFKIKKLSLWFFIFLGSKVKVHVNCPYSYTMIMYRKSSSIKNVLNWQYCWYLWCDYLFLDYYCKINQLDLDLFWLRSRSTWF